MTLHWTMKCKFALKVLLQRIKERIESATLLRKVLKNQRKIAGQKLMLILWIRKGVEDQ